MLSNEDRIVEITKNQDQYYINIIIAIMTCKSGLTHDTM